MRNTVLAVSLLAVVGLVAGCSSMANSVPGVGVPLWIDTPDSFEIIGRVQGTSTGGYLFGFIPIGVENKTGAIASAPSGGGQPPGGILRSIFPFNLIIAAASSPGGYDPVARAAVYNAIESVPNADALLAPRWNSLKKNYIIYSEKTVTVKGKAVRFVGSGTK